MSYVEHNFQSGDTLMALDLNEMDDQIYANEGNVTALQNILQLEAAAQVNLFNPNDPMTTPNGFYGYDGTWNDNENYIAPFMVVSPGDTIYKLTPDQTREFNYASVSYWTQSGDYVTGEEVTGSSITVPSNNAIYYMSIPVNQWDLTPVGSFLYIVFSKTYVNKFYPYNPGGDVDSGRIKRLEEAVDRGGNQWNDKTWYAYGTSITDISTRGKYPQYLETMSGMNLVCKGIGGGGIGDLGAYSEGQVYEAICNTTDGKLDADLITLETGANDTNDGVVNLGTIWDTGKSTLCGCLNDCIRYLQANTDAQIVVMPSPPNTSVPSSSVKQAYEWRELIRQICDINSVHFIPMDANLGFAKYNSDKGELYVEDTIHQTDLGGYILAENIWAKLKNIPLFRTELP